MTAPSNDRLRRLPARRLPLFYFALAHFSLALACLALALDPAAYAGFFYHPKLIALVHLVTLGWISGSILGALHLVAPMALRAPMPVRRLDYWAFAAFALGATGIPSHFWIGELSGVGWSGLLLTLVFVHVGRKTWRALRAARIPSEVKLHFALAFGNLGLAVLAGTLFGFNRWIPFLPGFTYRHALAHAHLAVVGWAVMMVFAVGYRLLPMLLPAAMPSGRGVRLGALLLEAGILGVFLCLLVESSWLAVFAAVTVSGILAFLLQVGWMLRHRKPSPKGLIRPDLGVVQVAQALVYLAVCSGLGVALTLLPADQHSLRLVWIYGVCGLVGFLAQMVVGVAHRLLPLYAWLTSFSASDWQELPPSPHALPDRRLQAATLALWTFAVPVLAAGFYGDYLGAVRLAAGMLLVAVLTGGWSHVVVLRRSAPAPARA